MEGHSAMEVQELEGRFFGEWERICRDEEAKGFAGLPHRDQAFHAPTPCPTVFMVSMNPCSGI